MKKELILMSIIGLTLTGCLEQPKAPTSNTKTITTKSLQPTSSIKLDQKHLHLTPSSQYNKKAALELSDVAKSVFNDSYGEYAYKRHGYQLAGHQNISQGLVDLQYAYGYKMLSKDSMAILIAIRGSKEATDWVTDANFIPKAYDKNIDAKITVHGGFLDSVNLLESKESVTKINSMTLSQLIDLNAQGKRKDIFLLTGHSLGGAIATLYTSKLIDKGIKKDQLMTYTFGAPPISMSEGADKENLVSNSLMKRATGLGSALLSDLTSSSKANEVNHYIDRYKNKINLVRFYDTNDVVPKLFAPSRHMGTAVGLEGKYGIRDFMSPMKILKTHNMKNYIQQIKDENFIK